ncbi:hypothetical protein MRB53_030553 [Persea americana]|uniref:Uncharacterized protein n=1 Tax=Persea americana TaxID=3435 RepID=A0ACC2KLG0_PERAE|nr:hypothetical protein MRB53_030553 [Persea americana]
MMGTRAVFAKGFGCEKVNVGLSHVAGWMLLVLMSNGDGDRHQVVDSEVFVRFGEVDSWIEDDEKTENQEMGIWESEGAIWFGGDNDGKKTVMLLRGLVKKPDMQELFGLVELRDDEKAFG